MIFAVFTPTVHTTSAFYTLYQKHLETLLTRFSFQDCILAFRNDDADTHVHFLTGSHQPLRFLPWSVTPMLHFSGRKTQLWLSVVNSTWIMNYKHCWTCCLVNLTCKIKFISIFYYYFFLTLFRHLCQKDPWPIKLTVYWEVMLSCCWLSVADHHP